MFLSTRQLQVAFKTTYLGLQRLGHASPTHTHLHPVRVRAFASACPTEATENSSFRDSPLFQQLSINSNALIALKEFVQSMKEQGIDVSPDRPPSTMELFKLLANPAFRKSLHKLREDLGNAGVNVDPENAMEMLNACKSRDTKLK